jgi:hypothetical protein
VYQKVQITTYRGSLKLKNFTDSNRRTRANHTQRSKQIHLGNGHIMARQSLLVDSRHRPRDDASAYRQTVTDHLSNFTSPSHKLSVAYATFKVKFNFGSRPVNYAGSCLTRTIKCCLLIDSFTAVRPSSRVTSTLRFMCLPCRPHAGEICDVYTTYIVKNSFVDGLLGSPTLHYRLRKKNNRFVRVFRLRGQEGLSTAEFSERHGRTAFGAMPTCSLRRGSKLRYTCEGEKDNTAPFSTPRLHESIRLRCPHKTGYQRTQDDGRSGFGGRRTSQHPGRPARREPPARLPANAQGQRGVVQKALFLGHTGERNHSAF